VDFHKGLLEAPEGLFHHINGAVQLHLHPIKVVIPIPDGRPPRLKLIQGFLPLQSSIHCRSWTEVSFAW